MTDILEYKTVVKSKENLYKIKDVYYEDNNQVNIDIKDIEIVEKIQECEICYNDELSKNLCCETCKKSFCIDCLNKMSSRIMGIMMIDDDDKDEDFVEKNSNIVLNFSCPWCRCENRKDVSVFTKEELIKICRKDYIELVNTNNIINSLETINRKLTYENANQDLYTKCHSSQEDTIDFIIRQNKDYKKEIDAVQEENIKLIVENDKYKSIVASVKTDLLTLKNERLKEQKDMLQDKVQLINEYNDMVYKINEMKQLLNELTIMHNNMYDETDRLIKNKKYKDLKKMYSGSVSVSIKLKEVNARKTE